MDPGPHFWVVVQFEIPPPRALRRLQNSMLLSNIQPCLSNERPKVFASLGAQKQSLKNGSREILSNNLMGYFFQTVPLPGPEAAGLEAVLIVRD